MKQRIVNKKLKKDVLLNLWIKQWRHTLDNMNNYIMPQGTQKDYQDHTSIWYCRFKLGMWMMDYEFLQVLKTGRKNHNIKTKQVYDYLMNRDMCAFKYHEYKKFFLKDLNIK